MTKIINFYNPNAEKEPQEPNWEKLHQALNEAEDWLRSEVGMDSFTGSFIAAVESVLLCRDMLSPEKFETQDDIIARFADHIDWTAFWLQGSTSDEKLRKRIMNMCGDPEAILKGLVKANKDSLH